MRTSIRSVFQRWSTSGLTTGRISAAVAFLALTAAVFADCAAGRAAEADLAAALSAVRVIEQQLDLQREELELQREELASIPRTLRAQEAEVAGWLVVEGGPSHLVVTNIGNGPVRHALLFLRSVGEPLQEGSPLRLASLAPGESTEVLCTHSYTPHPTEHGRMWASTACSVPGGTPTVLMACQCPLAGGNFSIQPTLFAWDALGGPRYTPGPGWGFIAEPGVVAPHLTDSIGAAGWSSALLRQHDDLLIESRARGRIE